MCVRNFQFLIFNFQLIMTHYITPEKLTFEQIEKILTKKYKLALSDESKKLINDCKAYLDHKIATCRQTVVWNHDRVRLSMQNFYFARRLKPITG